MALRIRAFNQSDAEFVLSLAPRLAGLEKRAQYARDEISEQEYDAFFAPYDARKTLDEIKGKGLTFRSINSLCHDTPAPQSCLKDRS
jgi:hypothetical protein